MTKLDRISPEVLHSNPRATLAAWQKYEQIVTAALSVHPKPFIYPCTSLKASTVASRLRDAIRGKIAFDYPSSLPTSTVTQWYNEVIIRPEGKNVYIGPLTKIKDVLDSGTSVSHDQNLSFPVLSFEEVCAFSLLLSNGHLRGPVHIFQPPDISLLPERPNLEVIKREDGSLVLL